MRKRFAAVSAVALLAACGEESTVQVTRLAGERFRVSVSAADISEAQRLIGPEAAKLCGGRPADLGETLMEPSKGLADPTIVQDVSCAEPTPAP